MALADNYRESENCTCCALYRQLSAKDKTFFDLKAQGPTRWLWQACVDDGWNVSETQFRVHLRRHHGTQ